MRILHIIDIPWHSGLADYALRLAGAERDAGHEVWFAAPSGTAAAAEAERAGLTHLPLARLRDLPALRRALAAHRIEIVNAHSGASQLLAAAAAEALRAPAAGGRAPLLVRTRADARRVRPRPFARALVRRTAAYVAATERIRGELLRELLLSEDFVRTVYPAVALPETWSPPAWPGPAPSDSPAGDGGPLVTLVGRLDPVKGHGVFLQAAARIRAAVPSARFAIVGRDEHVTTASLRAQARGLDLGECVLFAGHAGSVAPWMRGSAVGVIPSLGSEAVSRVALEWMAQARPVVASSVGGMPELIESGRSGLLVPPGRADALAEAVLSLLADPPWLRLLGEQARRSAETRFSTERLLRETARVYEEARCRG